MHDSFTALGGMIPLINMQLGEIIVGGVGAGLYGFLLFAILFMVLSYLTTTPEHSFIGRHAGGLFVWALSIPDAYRLAKIRYETFRRAAAGAG